MSRYDFEDVDLLLETFLMYTRQGDPIPPSAFVLLDQLIADDVRLGMVFYRRVRRYPSLKKAILLQPDYNDDDDEDEDDWDGILMKPPKLRARGEGMAGRFRKDRMFQ